MTEEATAISGTRRQYKEMADGTLRVQIDIDPQYKARFLELFGSIDMPVALAPLVADFEKPKEPEKQKGGELSKLAAMWCQDKRFWEWIEAEFVLPGYGLKCLNEKEARQYVIDACGINSRAELDHNVEAEKIFHERIRKPFSDYLVGRK